MNESKNLERSQIYCLKCKLKTDSVKITIKISKNKKYMVKGKCKICNSNKVSFTSSKTGGDIVSFLEKTLNPPEMHIPGYNFCGPFTKLEKRMNRGDNPINRVDGACLKHDIKYYKDKESSARHLADQELIDELNSIEKPSFAEKVSKAVIKPIIKAKLKFGLGVK
jgi:hypothetical protein